MGEKAKTVISAEKEEVIFRERERKKVDDYFTPYSKTNSR